MNELAHCLSATMVEVQTQPHAGFGAQLPALAHYAVKAPGLVEIAKRWIRLDEHEAYAGLKKFYEAPAKRQKAIVP